jgi:hypothetical protein
MINNLNNNDYILVAEQYDNIIDIRLRNRVSNQSERYRLSIQNQGQCIKNQWYEFCSSLQTNTKAAIFYQYETDKKYETWLLTQNGHVSLCTYHKDILISKHYLPNDKFKNFFEETVNYIIDDIPLEDYVKKQSFKINFRTIRRIISEKILRTNIDKH